MFVVGGEDGNYDAILPFAGMRTLSLQTDPALASRPFDRARDGFVGSPVYDREISTCTDDTWQGRPGRAAVRSPGGSGRENRSTRE